MQADESSIEFDMFEDVRLNLTRILLKEGRDPVEVERIAFYVVQGIRDVPKLMTALARGGTHDFDTDARNLLDIVLNNSSSLERARAIMHGHDDQPIH